MTRGKQTDLARALESLSKKLDQKSHGRYLQAAVLPAWEKVAGPSVTKHTARAHLRDGELVVYVDSPVWATELSALSGPYREAMNQELGRNAVRTVRFAVSRKVEMDRVVTEHEANTEEFYKPDTTVPVPLTAAERAQVEESAAHIPDKELREAVVKATVAGMEWRKGRKDQKSPHTPSGGL